MSPELKTLLDQWNRLNLTDRYEFQKTIQILGGRNIVFDGVQGTKIGTSATQKFSFWGVTTVVQPAAISAPQTQGATYSQSDVQSIVTAVNSIRTALKSIGITA